MHAAELLKVLIKGCSLTAWETPPDWSVSGSPKVFRDMQ
jgi:hypothetical protein